MIISLIFLKRINPLPLRLILILLALVEGILIWGLVSKWLGLALIIVFVGGIIVAFLYVSSLAFNLKFQIFFSLPGLFILIILTFLKPTKILKDFSGNFAVSVYSSMSSFLLVFLIIYLLIVLFLAVKITESLKGSLAQKF